MASIKTLLVEDDVVTRLRMQRVLEGRGHVVTACADAESGWAAYVGEQHPLVLLDWLLPGMDGLTLCRKLRAHEGGAASVILVTTGRDQSDDLAAVLDAGADDYLTKPIDAQLLNIRLAIAERQVARLLEHQRAEAQVSDLRRLLDEKARLEDLIGKSDRMRQVFQLIRDLAPVDTTVLIEGETGTGKELVARAIHSLSPRRSRRFVAVNCAGLTESLIASQLFGHKRGSFTGAIEDHVGFFEAAEGGTIFLDEIGDLPLTLQTSLLRVLQEREILRVGDSTPRKIDVRVLTATHRDLAHDVGTGAFRADLFYRIRVARVRLAPLRDRREDIPMLAAEFLRRAVASSGKRVEEISSAAIRMLASYDWPGNVRELASTIEFAVVRAAGSVILPADLPPEISEVTLTKIPAAVVGDTREQILAALAAAGGNRKEAAKVLGVSRATFYRRLDELGIDAGRKRVLS